jgi:hypothetical protein
MGIFAPIKICETFELSAAGSALIEDLGHLESLFPNRHRFSTSNPLDNCQPATASADHILTLKDFWHV